MIMMFGCDESCVDLAVVLISEVLVVYWKWCFGDVALRWWCSVDVLV